MFDPKLKWSLLHQVPKTRKRTHNDPRRYKRSNRRAIKTPYKDRVPVRIFKRLSSKFSHGFPGNGAVNLNHQCVAGARRLSYQHPAIIRSSIRMHSTLMNPEDR